jgi:biopolymer transport protein ExbD
MSTMRFVCLLASTLATAAVLMAVAQSQTLQRGISVQLAATSNAAPMPDADNQNAWIVTLADDGSLYFGIDPVTRDGLVDEMIRTPRSREQKLYIKADARAPYADVEYVFKAARTAGFDAPVFLTAQPESAAPGSIVPPKGLEVFATAPSNGDSVAVQIGTGQPSPTLKINNADASLAALQNTLRRLLTNQNEKVVVVKAAGSVPFGQVAYVMDVARSTGAKVVLAGPSL